MAIQFTPEHSIDLDGFGGVRERIYIHDPRMFGRVSPPGATTGLGQSVYLADASLRPGRSTGRHSHRNVDILTLVLNGSLLHRGTLGDETRLDTGMAMLQRASDTPFEHDEINPTAHFNRFLQLWLLPDISQPTPAFSSMNVGNPGLHTLYTGTTPDDRGNVTRIRWLNAHTATAVSIDGPGQLFVAQGQLVSTVPDSGAHPYGRGLVQGNTLQGTAAPDTALLIIDRISIL